MGRGNSGKTERDLVEIARIMTFATASRRDIVRRLMGTSDAFKGLTFADAAEQFRYAERNGLVKRGDGYLVVYHDTTLTSDERKKRRRG